MNNSEVDEFHKYVLEAFDLRNVGDYGAMHAVPKEKAEELMSNARELIDTVQEFIHKDRQKSIIDR